MEHNLDTSYIGNIIANKIQSGDPFWYCLEDFEDSEIDTIINTDNWGNLCLQKIDNAFDFWALIDELASDDSEFIYNKETLLDSYVSGNLYGLRITESTPMYKSMTRGHPLFCKDSFYLLPCLCVKNDEKAVIIWTHSRARKMGFAKLLVKLLNIKYADTPLPESIGFWKKIGIL